MLSDEMIEQMSMRMALTIKLSVMVGAIQSIKPTGYAKQFLEKKNLMGEYKEYVKQELKVILERINNEITDEERDYLKKNEKDFHDIMNNILNGKSDPPEEKRKRGRPKKGVE